MRNTYHGPDDSNNWKVIGLQDFDLLGHVHDMDGKLNCMMAFGFTMEDSESIVVATGAPRIRYVPLPFELPPAITAITFSFNQWCFDFMEKEYLAVGAADFVKDLEATDELDDTAFALAAKVAVAKIKVCRNPSDSDEALWGVYSQLKEAWIAGEEISHIDKTMH